MKNFKLLSVLAMGLAAFAFTSCLNSNNDGGSSYTPLTAQEKTYCYTMTSGSHTGGIIYNSDEHKTAINDYTDTLFTSCNIHTNITRKDTTMTIQNFPVKILARYIPESSETNELKTALKAYEGTVDIESSVFYVTATPIQFYLTPTKFSVNLTYGEQEHTVNFYFYSNGTSLCNYGLANSNDNNKLSMQLLLGGYAIDNTKDDYSNFNKFSYSMGGTNLSSLALVFYEGLTSTGTTSQN